MVTHHDKCNPCSCSASRSRGDNYPNSWTRNWWSEPIRAKAAELLRHDWSDSATTSGPGWTRSGSGFPSVNPAQVDHNLWNNPGFWSCSGSFWFPPAATGDHHTVPALLQPRPDSEELPGTESLLYLSVNWVRTNAAEGFSLVFSGMETHHQLPVLRSSRLQFPVQHDISVSWFACFCFTAADVAAADTTQEVLKLQLS